MAPVLDVGTIGEPVAAEPAPTGDPEVATANPDDAAVPVALDHIVSIR